MMKKVIIIENDEYTLDMLGSVAKLAEVEVVMKSDAIPVAEIEKINPDLIILDHWLDVKLGSDLCLEIKQNQATKDIPVVMVSALGNINEIASRSCADGAIQKPFDIDDILNIIISYTL